jgi:transcription initiation factor TFIID subunit 1
MDYIPSPKTLTIDPNDDNIILEIPEDKDPSAPETPAKKEKVTLMEYCLIIYIIQIWTF